MDFIEELPSSNDYNSILVVVDRLTKWAIFIPTTRSLSFGKVGLPWSNLAGMTRGHAWV